MTPISYWIGFHLALLALLGAEYLLHLAFPNTRRKAIYAMLLWVTAAVGFAALLVRPYHAVGATQFLAGYVLEQSLSIDNLFVFLLLFRLFRIPEARQPKVLFWGVAGESGEPRRYGYLCDARRVHRCRRGVAAPLSLD